jgi:RimJ/RimL family protein N-acetyltransferase
MIKGKSVLLRPLRDEDMPLLEGWACNRETLAGPYLRYQLDHLTGFREGYRQDGLLTRQRGILLIEREDDACPVGIVSYKLAEFVDDDAPHPAIGFVVADPGARGQGLGTEAVRLLVDYLFAGYPSERVSAFSDVENEPARKLLETLGFQREGVLRRIGFRDGRWRDWAVFGILREEWV